MAFGPMKTFFSLLIEAEFYATLTTVTVAISCSLSMISFGTVSLRCHWTFNKLLIFLTFFYACLPEEGREAYKSVVSMNLRTLGKIH